MINFTKPTFLFEELGPITGCYLSTQVSFPKHYIQYVIDWAKQYSNENFRSEIQNDSMDITVIGGTTCRVVDTYDEELGKKITKVKAYKQLYTALFNLCNYICKKSATSIFSKYYEKTLDSRILTEDCIVADMYKYFKLAERERNYFKKISNI